MVANKMSVIVSQRFDALHFWPRAEGRREYLANMHHHVFTVTITAEVTHADRDIEFHDLKKGLEEVILSLGDEHSGVRSLGSMSCEDIGNSILRSIPYINSVRVMEDEECGAEVIRPKGSPKVITICGSTRFKKETLEARESLELMGYAVFSVGSFLHADQIPITLDQKRYLDELHLRKIDMSDSIYVINVDGYIGESTRREIEYAESHSKGVTYLCPVTPCQP